eukprot:3193203-Pyramimonas_sp.AAC.1
MAHQGTVFGPSLWKELYADARDPIATSGFQKKIADDLNAFKPFDTSVGDSTILAHLEARQQELHKWGRANGATFEPDMESSHIVPHSPRKGATSKS